MGCPHTHTQTRAQAQFILANAPADMFFGRLEETGTLGGNLHGYWENTHTWTVIELGTLEL